MTGTGWTVTRDQLIDAVSHITADIPLTGPDAGKINAESVADVILAQLPAVTCTIGVSSLTGEPLAVSPEAEAAMRDAGLAVLSQQALREGLDAALSDHERWSLRQRAAYLRLLVAAGVSGDGRSGAQDGAERPDAPSPVSQDPAELKRPLSDVPVTGGAL